MADVPIVYLVAEATRLLGRPADWRCHLFDPFRRAFFLPVQSYLIAVVLDNKKGAAYMGSGEGVRPGDAGPERQKGRMAVQGEAIADVATTSSPVCCGLACRADRLLLPLLFHGQRPLEHREGGGLSLAACGPSA